MTLRQLEKLALLGRFDGGLTYGCESRPTAPYAVHGVGNRTTCADCWHGYGPGARYRTRRLFCDSDKRFAVDSEIKLQHTAKRAVLGQEIRLRSEPLPDGEGTLLLIRWPILEAVFRQLVGFDAKRVQDDPGGPVAIVAFDCLLDKVCRRVRPSSPTARL